MQGTVIIENAKVLNLVEKTAQSNDGKPITWYEIVFMTGSDVNTITINKNLYEELEIDNVYDLLMEITETLRAYKDRSFKNHKFRIVGTCNL